jgi:hypothetical protein
METSDAKTANANSLLVTRPINIGARPVNAALIIGVGVLVFSPCLFDFFLSDDFVWISGGVDLPLGDLFRNSPQPTYNIFRPLVVVLFSAFHWVFRLSPFGYHLTSILVHSINGLLFYSILSRLSLRKDVALVAAVIFVTHFAHEESVFWISSICVLGCWFFCLSSILTFLAWMENGRIRFYFLSLCLGATALFLREDAFTLPLILCFIVWLQNLRSKHEPGNVLGVKMGGRVAIGLAPFFLTLPGYLYLRSISLPHLQFGALFSLNPVNVVRNSAYFLANLTFPTRIVFDAIGYRHSAIINSAVNSIDSNLVLVLVTFFIIAISAWALFIWGRRAGRNSKLLALAFLVALLPLVFFRAYGLRFTYLPLLGFSPAAASVLFWFVKKVSRSHPRVEKRCVCVSLILIILLNFLVLFERHLWWSKAGQTCEETLASAGSAISSLPPGSTACFLDLPSRINGAYVFKNGFVEAMSLFHPSSTTKIRIVDSESLGSPYEAVTEDCFRFRYEEREFLPLDSEKEARDAINRARDAVFSYLTGRQGARGQLKSRESL